MADFYDMARAIDHPNLLASFQDGQKIGQAQRDRRNQQQAGDLYAQAMQAPAEQRPALLAHIAKLSGVEGATNAQAGLDKQREAAHADLVQAAQTFVAVADQPDLAAQLYPQIAAKAHAINIPVPPTYDPKMLPAIQKIASLGQESTGNQVHSAFRGQNGNMWILDRNGQARDTGAPFDPNMQIIDNGQGFYGVSKTNAQATPVTVGAPQAPQRAPGEVPFTVDPSLPPDVQATIRANPNAGSAQGITSLPTVAQGAPQLRSMPKPADIRAEQAQALQMSEFAAKQSHTLSPAEVAARGYRPGTIVQVDGYGNESVKQAPEAARNSMSDVDRRAILAAKQKVPQLQNAIRGLDRIDSAIKALDGGLVDTGPLDQFAQRYTKQGQELEAAVGGIQNSILALTRVPGIGSQSDLEARIAMLQYPSLDKAPEVNRRTLENLRYFMRDLADAYQNVLSQPDTAPSVSHGDATPAPAASGGWSIQEVR